MLRNDTTNKKVVNGQVYWRADSRSPSEIFQVGFQAMTPINPDNWWGNVLSRETPDLVAGYTQASKAISISTNIFSSPLFPQRNDRQPDACPVVYLYALALPPEQKMNLNKQITTGEIHSVNPARTIIDLHSYQTLSVANILSNNAEDYFNNPALALVAASPLYAYEAIAHHIDPSNIIFAVKVTRLTQQVDRVPTHQLRLGLNYCEFTIDNNIIKNPQFKSSEVISGSTMQAQLEYSQNQVDAANLVNLLLNKKSDENLMTTRASHGLGGKTFAVPANTYAIIEPDGNTRLVEKSDHALLLAHHPTLFQPLQNKHKEKDRETKKLFSELLAKKLTELNSSCELNCTCHASAVKKP